jgi:hypothetical protein
VLAGHGGFGLDADRFGQEAADRSFAQIDAKRLELDGGVVRIDFTLPTTCASRSSVS